MSAGKVAGQGDLPHRVYRPVMLVFGSGGEERKLALGGWRARSDWEAAFRPSPAQFFLPLIII